MTFKKNTKTIKWPVIKLQIHMINFNSKINKTILKIKFNLMINLIKIKTF